MISTPLKAFNILVMEELGKDVMTMYEYQREVVIFAKIGFDPFQVELQKMMIRKKLKQPPKDWVYCLSISSLINFGRQMFQLAQGLHELRFIHRDLKPENFMLGRGINRE